MNRLWSPDRTPGLVAAVVLSLMACTASPSATPAAIGSPSVGSRGPTVAVQTASAPLNPPVKVLVGDSQVANRGGVYIALDRGYFKQEGLDVELVQVGGIPEQVQELAAGHLSVAAATADPSVYNAVARGLDLKLIASYSVLAKGFKGSGVVVRQDLIDGGQYKSLSDMKGLRIALSPGVAAQFVVQRILSSAGVTLADVSLESLNLTDIPAALASKRIDAALLLEPLIGRTEASGVARLVAPTGDAFDYPYPQAFVALSPVFASEQPEAARRFTKALLRGQRDYWRAVDRDEGGRDDIIRILTKYTSITDPTVYDNMAARHSLGGIDPNGDFDDRALTDPQDYFMHINALQTRLDVSQLVDRSYLEYAWAQIGRLP